MSMRMIKPKFPYKLNGDLVSYLLENFEGEIDEMTITDARHDKMDLSMLLNWEIGTTYDHENKREDGTYEFTGYFISPEGYEYKVYSYHSLLTGWNMHNEIIEFD